MPLKFPLFLFAGECGTRLFGTTRRSVFLTIYEFNNAIYHILYLCMEISFNRGKIHFSRHAPLEMENDDENSIDFFGANAMSKCIPLVRFKSLVVFPSVVDSVI